MSKKRELAKSTFIIFIGTFFTKIMTFLLLPLYTGLLTTKEYGTLELLNTLITLLVPIINLQIDQGIFRYLVKCRDNLEEKKTYISTAINFVFITTVLYLLLFFIISPFINNNYKYYLALNVIFNSFSCIFLQISRGLGENAKYAFSGFLISLVTIVLNVLFLCGLKTGIEGMLVSSVIGYVFGILYLFISLKLFNLYSFKIFNYIKLKELLNYSLPLIPNAISWWVFSVSDRIIVSLIIGLSATGILSVSYKLSSIYIVIYNVFNTSLTESVALHINDSDISDYFNDVFIKISDLFISVGFLLIAFMPIIFKILINSNYLEAYNLIPIAIIASIFQVIVGLTGTLYAAKNNTKSLAKTAIVSALINVIVDLLLINFIGLYAAVVSTLVSYFVLAVYRIVDINKLYFKINLSAKDIFIFIFVLIIILLSYYFQNIIIKIFGMIFCLIFVIIYNKNSIHLIMNILKKKKNKEV